MFRVSAPNRTVGFTSGPGSTPSFRLRVEGDLDQFDVLEIEAEIGEYDASEYEGDLNNLITIEHMGSRQQLPVKEYLPSRGANKANLAFQVYRGQLYDQEEIQEYTAKMSVYGGEGVDRKLLGEDTVVLEG